jgi:hypothetical protein
MERRRDRVGNAARRLADDVDPGVDRPPVASITGGRHALSRGTAMYVGLGVFLLVVGAVLAFAISATVSGIDLSVVGWILMAGGVVAIVLSLAMTRRRGFASRRVTQVDPVTGTQVQDSRIEPQ